MPFPEQLISGEGILLAQVSFGCSFARVDTNAMENVVRSNDVTVFLCTAEKGGMVQASKARREAAKLLSLIEETTVEIHGTQKVLLLTGCDEWCIGRWCGFCQAPGLRNLDSSYLVSWLAAKRRRGKRGAFEGSVVRELPVCKLQALCVTVLRDEVDVEAVLTLSFPVASSKAQRGATCKTAHGERSSVYSSVLWEKRSSLKMSSSGVHFASLFTLFLPLSTRHAVKAGTSISHLR